ncbi:MAG: hypothetical protein V1661_03305 [bacterium]
MFSILFALSLAFVPALALADEYGNKVQSDITVTSEQEQKAAEAQKEADKNKVEAQKEADKNQAEAQKEEENKGEDVSSTDENENKSASDTGSNNEYDNKSATSEIKNVSPRSEKALQKMSDTAKKVEEILTTSGAKGGIGEEVKKVAQQEKDDQQETKDSLSKIDKRSGLVKFLIGANFKEVENVRANLVRLDARIKKLNDLLGTVGDPNLKTLASSTLSALEQQKTALEDKVRAEESTFSLFGWFAKLFAK